MLSPADFGTLPQRDLSQSTCVVFDILRATTSIVTALANGAEAIIPVAEITEALALRRHQPELLLAGEREGLRIGANLTGGIDFDFGNSPREFTAARVKGRRIAITTTNGTRALRACAGARTVLVGSFLNMAATAALLEKEKPAHLILVCSGTFDEPAFEDLLAAGGLCERLWADFAEGHVADSAEAVRRLFEPVRSNLLEAVKSSRNGRRLLSIPELREDVSVCAQRDTVSFPVALDKDGIVRKLA